MSGLVWFLLFVTAWVIIIAALIYLVRRLTTPPPQRGKCCLEVPCSTKCAVEHQAMRDRLGVDHAKIVHELGKIVTAGQNELEAADAREDWPAASRS